MYLLYQTGYNLTKSCICSYDIPISVFLSENTNLMKLLLLFHHYRTGAERGGHRSSMIARCLKSAGYSVTAIVPGIDSLSGKAHSSMGDSWKSISYDQGVKVVRVRGTKNNRSSVFARIMYYVTSSIMQFFTALRERDVCLVMCTSMPLTSLIF